MDFDFPSSKTVDPHLQWSFAPSQLGVVVGAFQAAPQFPYNVDHKINNNYYY